MEVFASERGWREALRMAQDRKGHWFDPELVKVLSAFRDNEWWNALYRGDPLDGLPGLEPDDRVRMVDDGGIDRVAEAFAEVVDAKSPFTYRHSTRVAELARKVAVVCGSPSHTARLVYRAGLLHDIGKLGVSNRILDKAGPLTEGERATVERHPILTWSILSQVRIFSPIARLASVHHERLDGRGYPWGIGAGEMDQHDRILAVCDIFEALTADRPYRVGMGEDKALSILRSLSASVDQDVVEVLAGLGKETGDIWSAVT
jgi:putative nucleotidyltransferase with HDIG domain